MAIQISSSSIAFYKADFDLLYQTYIASPDAQKISQAIKRMAELQGHMLKAIQHAASTPPSRLLQEATVNAETIKHEIQVKLDRMIARNSALASPSPAAPIPSTSSKSQSVQRSISSPTDLAIGFGNMGNNCWINSLLSMLPSLPFFRTAFETFGKTSVQSGNADDKKHGQYILDALAEYDAALAKTQSVPSHISQNVRLAFHHFFPTISESCHHSEDAYEAMQLLMGRSEQSIPSFPLLTTKRHYRPVGALKDADPAKVRADQYSELTQDNISASSQKDYQILLDLQNKGHLSFSELVAEYFCNTHLHHDNGTYLLPDKRHLQQFELIGEGRQFARAPEELLLTIKRFGANIDGTGFKIATPLAVSATLVLPAIATADFRAATYELDAFNVHSGGFGGGHYSTFRRVEGRWIEINDTAVRFVSEEEIAVILEGRKGPEYTTYMHHYVRIAGAELPESKLTDIAALELETAELTQSIRLLEENTELNHLPAHLLETLRLIAWMHDKTPEIDNYGSTALAANPQKVREIRLPWLIAGSDSLWAQMLKVQTIKLKIAKEKCNEAKLRAFLAQLGSQASNDELLASLKRLPQSVQNTLHGLIYQSHLIKLGREKVAQPEYGKRALEEGDIRRTLLEATESVLNLWGKNIALQLIADTELKIEKLEMNFAMQQLKGFHELLTRSPQEVTNPALVKAFERLEVRKEIKEKLMWHIWYGHKTPAVFDYGLNTFRGNPRVLLSIQEPNLARPPLCPKDANILWQMIKLLDHASR